MRSAPQTFCLANIEAMSRGLPVVSYAYGGPSDYMISGYNGIIVREVSGGELGRVLDAIGNDEEGRRR